MYYSWCNVIYNSRVKASTQILDSCYTNCCLCEKFYTFYKTAKENLNWTLDWKVTEYIPSSSIWYNIICTCSPRSTRVNLLGILDRNKTNLLTKKQMLSSNCKMLFLRKELLTLLYNPDYLFFLTIMIHSNTSKIIYSWAVFQLKIVIKIVLRLQYPPIEHHT